jgi:integrase
MPAVKLTKAAIERIKAPDPSGKQAIVWDTDLKGFGLLVSGTTSSKSYIAQRRLPDGRSRRLTVGAVGEFEGVEAARRKAGALLAGLREGKDPKEARRVAAARDRSLRAWLDLYLTPRKNRPLRERSIEEYRRGVTRHLETWLDRPLREITPDMIEDKHAAIGKAAGPAVANGVMRAARAIWNFALDRDDSLAANPVRRLKDGWFPLPPRTRSVGDDELPAFYKAVDELPNRAARDYILMLLFTGLRRREAAELQWSEVDFTERAIRLPAGRTKANRPLDLPMTNFVRDLLITRRALGDDGPFVFAADSRSGHIEEPKFAFQQVAQRSGIAVSCHDLRRTYVTVAEAADVSIMSLKSLVNYSLGHGVTEGYVQMKTDRLREPAQRVCDRLVALCGIAAPDGAIRVS